MTEPGSGPEDSGQGARWVGGRNNSSLKQRQMHFTLRKSRSPQVPWSPFAFCPEFEYLFQRRAVFFCQSHVSGHAQACCAAPMAHVSASTWKDLYSGAPHPTLLLAANALNRGVESQLVVDFSVQASWPHADSNTLGILAPSVVIMRILNLTESHCLCLTTG